MPGTTTAAGKAAAPWTPRTKLTPDQLATLAPGDDVTIEAGAEFGRTRHRTGTVTRVADTSVLVTVQSAGRGNDGALVTAPGPDAVTDDRRREQPRINVLWRAWSRDPDDVAALRELHAAMAIGCGSWPIT